MKHPISAGYGDTLEQAAVKAVAARASLSQTLSLCDVLPRFEFDFHGLSLPLDADTTAESLIADVNAAYQARSELYANTPASEAAFEREQGGKLGERLDDCVLAAIQCGARWGNNALRTDGYSMARLRHVFEFNGIREPFNPWKTGEAARVLAAVNAQLGAAGSRQVELPEPANS